MKRVPVSIHTGVGLSQELADWIDTLSVKHGHIGRGAVIRMLLAQAKANDIDAHERQVQGAIRVVRAAGHASVSLLQRNLGVTWATANALITELQERGEVSEVLVGNGHENEPV